jgi:hypothetical protein
MQLDPNKTRAGLQKIYSISGLVLRRTNAFARGFPGCFPNEYAHRVMKALVLTRMSVERSYFRSGVKVLIAALFSDT